MLDSNFCDEEDLEEDQTQAIIIAKCKSDEIKIRGRKIVVSKEAIAILTVLMDLLITFILWISILMLDPLQVNTENEVNKEIINPMDFTVVVTQDPHSDPIDDLEGIYWAWAENINQREMIELTYGKIDKIDGSKTSEIDENQNNVFNVSKALSNVGYLSYWKEIGKLLLKKKKNDAMLH